MEQRTDGERDELASAREARALTAFKERYLACLRNTRDEAKAAAKAALDAGLSKQAVYDATCECLVQMHRDEEG